MSATEFDAYERNIWAGRAAAYARSYAKLCAHTVPLLLDAAKVGDGTRVLDAGTGPGTLAAAACARGAVVAAVDAEPGMVDLAAKAAAGADVRLATLPDLPFEDGSFDAALSNFVINHVGRPVEAVAELRRVTRPGGLVAVTIWGFPGASGQQLNSRALEAGGAVRPPDVPSGPAPQDDFARTDEGFAELLTRAGLTDVHAEYVYWDHRATADEWWSGPAGGVATSGRILLSQTAEIAAEIKRRFDAISAEFLAEDGLLALPHKAILAVGRA